MIYVIPCRAFFVHVVEKVKRNASFLGEMFVLKLPHPHFLVKNEEFISNSCSPLLVVRNIWLASMVCKWKSMESLEDWAYLYYSIWNPVSHNQYAGAWIWTINSAECRWKLKILPFQRMIYRKKFNWKMFVMMLMLFHFVDSVEFKKHIFIFHNVGWCSWNEEIDSSIIFINSFKQRIRW